MSRHVLREKNTETKKSVGPLVSRQERRAGFVPRINRGSTFGVVPPSVYIGFRLFVSIFFFQGSCVRCPGSYEGKLSPGRTDPSASRPAWPRPAPLPHRAPPRPDPPVVCPGFELDRYLLKLVSCKAYPGKSYTTVRNVFSKARPNGTLYKPKDKQTVRWTSRTANALHL